MKILILGGYGVFGGRLAALLSDLSQLELLISGRTARAAREFCDNFRGAATATPTVLDRQDIESGLDRLQPDLVVDASGPFQNYGDDPYRIVKACLAAKCNYLDFADGADFVAGISAFDHPAKQAGIFILSGVSSFPVLTAAVVREMEKEMTVQTVVGGIAPSPYAGIGLNVMRAVVGYAGSPVKLRRDGRDMTVAGLTESIRYTIAPPGRIPLHNIRYSLVEVPDLQVIPKEHPDLKSIWMGAGPLPESLHRILNLLAKTRARLRLPSYTGLAPFFYRVLNLMKFGEHRGGMFVHATGFRNNAPVEMSWHLLAEGDDGPLIPSMAIEFIVRKQLAGVAPDPGARAATKALCLADYEELFAARTIYTGFRRSDDITGPLYQQILGTAFEDMPAPIKRLHRVTHVHQWTGTARVTGASNPLAALIARLFGFPTQSHTSDAEVTISRDAKGELWQRKFGACRFESHQTVGKGRNANLLVERFGPIRVAMALEITQSGLRLIPRRWSFLGLALPKSLIPQGDYFEHAEDGNFNFNVEIEAPLIGRIVTYKGGLSPADKSWSGSEKTGADLLNL
jgi:hypothetical protein